jgi:hypothetical protein
MTHGSDLAFPFLETGAMQGESISLGLSKREAFAMAAITATAPHLVGANDRQIQEFADAAAKIADAMVVALNREATA